MFLLSVPRKALVEVLEPTELWDPFKADVLARAHAGEEMQEPELYPKIELIFPSGEPLPQAWINPHYRDNPLTPDYVPAFATMA